MGSPSIAKYGGIRRYVSIVEDDTSPIRTAAAAQELRDAILSDLKDPDADHAIETFGAWWPGEPGVDLYEFALNTYLYDNAQTLAPYAIEISFQQGSLAKATIASRGKPSGGSGRWFGRRPGGGASATNWVAITGHALIPVIDGAGNAGFNVAIYYAHGPDTANLAFLYSFVRPNPSPPPASTTYDRDYTEAVAADFTHILENGSGTAQIFYAGDSFVPVDVTPLTASGIRGTTVPKNVESFTTTGSGTRLTDGTNTYAGKAATLGANLSLDTDTDGNPRAALTPGLTGVLGHDGDDMGTKTANFTWDATAGNIQRVTIGANGIAPTLTNFPTAYIAPCILIIEYGGSYVPDLSGLDWGDAGEPAWSGVSTKADFAWVMRVGNVYMASGQTGHANP